MTKEEEIKTEGIVENKENESYFDGDPWAFFFIKLGLFLLKVITLWIAQPFCEVIKNRYELSHTVIDGRRLKFVGKASRIFAMNMLWNFLSFISVFVLSAYKVAKMKLWVVKNTEFEDEGTRIDVEDEEEGSQFYGSIKELNKTVLKATLVTIFTLFLLMPLGVYWIEMYFKNNTYISGHKLKLDISFKVFYKKWLSWMGLSIVTLGVYLVFLNVKQRRYFIKYTHIES